MGDSRPRPCEVDESSESRCPKIRRLDSLTATVATEVNDLRGQVECPEMISDDEDDPCCNHVPTDHAHKEILCSSLLSDYAGECKDCHRKEVPASDMCSPKYHRILVCLECGRHSCGDSRSYLPYGHAQDHARQEQHWVAALFDDPQTGFCFKCECEQPVYPDPHDDDEVQFIGETRAGHAFGFDIPPDLATGMLNVSDAWRAFELGSVNPPGYAIRGMSNRGNTCYVNAMVQCLLALDKLRARMLGPDPPTGHLGMALRGLFVEANTDDPTGGVLNPDELLRSVRLYSCKYEAYMMHHSYELLESLRNALQDEESGIQTLDKEGGGLTVIDSIFRGELTETRSCINCQSASVFQEYFWDLSLSLPSMGDQFKISTSSPPQASKGLKSQPMKVANLENIEACLLGSELIDLHVVETSEPMEIDSTEARCTWQNKDVVQDPLYPHEDKDLCFEVSRRIAKEPPYSAGFVPYSYSDAKVQQIFDVTTNFPYAKDMSPPPLISPLSGHDESRMRSSLVRYANSTEAQCTWQSKNVLQDPLYPDEDKDLCFEVSRRIIKEPPYSVGFVPHSISNTKVEQIFEVMTTSSPLVEEIGPPPLVSLVSGHEESTEVVNVYQNGKGIGDNNSILTIEDCLSLFFEEEVVERSCDCSNVPKESHANQSGNGRQIEINNNDETSVDVGDKETKYHDGIQQVACYQTNPLSAEQNQNLILPNQDLGKRVALDLGSERDNPNEHKETSGCAIQRPRITKLPPVLTLHLKRYTKNGNDYHKNEAHVSYKEHLDVGQFIDSSSLDNNNSIYRLASVVEHCGGLNVGHYVAYVRARKIENQQQQSSCSSSWFCVNDSYIREVTLHEVLKCKGYVLFYERMEGQDMTTHQDNSNKAI